MSEGGRDTSALKETDVGGRRGGQRGIQTQNRSRLRNRMLVTLQQLVKSSLSRA